MDHLIVLSSGGICREITPNRFPTPKKVLAQNINKGFEMITPGVEKNSKTPHDVVEHIPMES